VNDLPIDVSGGANIGGYSFASLGMKLLSSNIPILPEARQQEDEIPGMDGSLDLGTEYGPRQIELNVFVGSISKIELHSKLAKIASIFSPKRGIQPLVIFPQTGKLFNVKFNGSLPLEKIGAMNGKFTIPLKAFDPIAYSVTDTSEPLKLGQGYTLGQGLRLGDNYTFEAKQSVTTFSVYHAGTHEAKSLIRITGTGNNLILTNDSTKEGMNIDLSLIQGDILEIDCKLNRITINGSNAFYAFSGVYPKLIEGENIFTVSASNPNLQIEFIFRHAYLY
jgi:phage-related protein